MSEKIFCKQISRCLKVEGEYSCLTCTMTENISHDYSTIEYVICLNQAYLMNWAHINGQLIDY